MTEAWLEESNRLHERVQRFAAGASADSFEQLALDLARFQASSSVGFGRLLRARGGKLESIDDIPPVPSDAFRLARVATYAAELDAVRFFTSGTTGAERGTHAMRRTDTYEQLSLAYGRHALLGPVGKAVVVALAPPLTQPPSSSLGYMMARFMDQFDGEALPGAETTFSSASSARWLLSESGVNLAGLQLAADVAQARGVPVLLLGTAFALVQLLDDLAGKRLPLPSDSVVMQTGGFKGRTREVSMEELRAGVADAVQLGSVRVVGEYGMTELTSQLYEGTIAESALAQQKPAASPGIYFEPPWLRVTPVDPVSLSAVVEGEAGLACFTDLGNVDSALRVVTQDLVRREQGGIRLLGRQPGAPARGCSLAIEALLHG
ncbi:MAG TPA: acyl-protein synthetase [Polyangiaceae bacterium]|nr:acyl-protein synthetase [Polyangiaceae bacterium]